MAGLVTLRESANGSTVKVDRVAGVISGVKFLGFESRNLARNLGLEKSRFGKALSKPYRYSESHAREVASKYNGLKINLDHWRDGNDRPVTTVFGKAANAEFRPDGIYGDIRFVPSHPSADFICDVAESMPDLLGLSHVANGEPSLKNGSVCIEQWEPVSVDLVSTPATTKGLHESLRNPMPKTTLREIVTQHQDAELLTLLKEMEDADMLDGSAAVDIGPPEEAEPEDALKGALMTMLTAKLEKAGADELKKLLKVLGVEDSLSAAIGGKSSEPKSGGSDPPADDKSDDDKDKAEESLKELVTLRSKTALLESGRKASDVRIKAVSSCATAAERTALIETWAADLVESHSQERRPRPSSSPPANPSHVTSGRRESFRKRLYGNHVAQG